MSPEPLLTFKMNKKILEGKWKYFTCFLITLGWLGEVILESLAFHWPTGIFRKSTLLFLVFRILFLPSGSVTILIQFIFIENCKQNYLANQTDFTDN